MKRQFLFALCALSAGSIYAAPVIQNGEIHITGSIYSSSCEIDINGQGPSNATIDLGRHPSSTFAEKGDEVGYNGTRGIIKISLDNCPDNGKLDVSFNGTTISGDKTILELDNPNSSDTAKNIGVRLYEKEDIDTPIRIDNSVAFSADVKGSKTYKKEFWTTYISTEDKVGAGQANATLGFKIEYK